MPKLLDFMKEKGISHADAIKLIDKHFIKPEDNTDEVEEPDIKEGEDDNPEDEVDEEEAKLEVLVQKLADEEEAKIKAKDEADKIIIAKRVQEELKKRGKIKRKTPSKGKVTDIPKLDYDINIKGYEVKTIRKTKD